MDSIDIKILNDLLDNSRSSTTSISKQLNISNVATQQRITKLQDQGVIQRFSAKLDYAKLGYKTISYLGIFLEKAKDYQSVIKELEKVPQVAEAHFTTGNYSIFAKVYARDNQHLMDILNGHIQGIKGIARTETFISLHEGINKEIKLK